MVCVTRDIVSVTRDMVSVTRDMVSVVAATSVTSSHNTLGDTHGYRSEHPQVAFDTEGPFWKTKNSKRLVRTIRDTSIGQRIVLTITTRTTTIIHHLNDGKTH